MMHTEFQFLTDDHRLIAEAVERLFADLAAADAAERLKAGRRLDPAVVEAALCEIGIAAGTEPDVMMYLALVQTQVALAAGTACLAYPVLETLLVQGLAMSIGRAVEGCAVSTVAGFGGSATGASPLTLARVAFVSRHSRLLVPLADGFGLIARNERDFALRAVRSVEPDYDLHDVSVSAAALGGVEPLGDARASASLAQRACLLAAAEIAGACRTMVRMTRDHLMSREQFGRTLGSNQALKHHIADAYVQTEALVSAVSYAAAASDAADEEASALIAAVKLFAGNAGKFVSEAAMQLHGAIGYTSEYPLHLYMRRAHRLGSSHTARDALERNLLREFQREGIPKLFVFSGDSR